MTWLEDERSERERLWAAFEAMRREFSELRHSVDSALARQSHSLETAIGNQSLALEATLGKQNAAIEMQNGALERGLKEQTRFFFLAWAVLMAFVVGLYARVG